MNKWLMIAVLLPVSAFAETLDVTTMIDGKVMQGTVHTYRFGRFEMTDTNGIQRTLNGRDVKEIVFRAVDDSEPGNARTTSNTPFQMPNPANLETSAPATIETVGLFPSRYVGKLLVFDGCEVAQKPERTEIDGLFAVGVTSPGKEYITPILDREGITFGVCGAMAESMVKRAGGGYDWTACRLYTAVVKVQAYVIAAIMQLDVYNRGGRLSLTFKSDGTCIDHIRENMPDSAEAKLRAEWEAVSPTVKRHYQTYENWRKTKTGN